MLRDLIFKDFHEYWYYARYLSESQRTTIYNSLSSDQRKHLNSSYKKGAWSDVFFRNEIDKFIDGLKERYGYDLLELRAKVFTGKSVYIPTKFWDIVLGEMDEYDQRYTEYVVSDIKGIQCEENPNVTLLVLDK